MVQRALVAALRGAARSPTGARVARGVALVALALGACRTPSLPRVPATTHGAGDARECPACPSCQPRATELRTARADASGPERDEATDGDDDRPPAQGVSRRRIVTPDGRAFIEVRTPSYGFLLPVVPPPGACRVVSTQQSRFADAGAISVALAGRQLLVATERWSTTQQETVVLRQQLGARTAPVEVVLPRAVAPRAFVVAGDLALTGWEQGAGAFFRRFPAHASIGLPEGVVRGLASVHGVVPAPGGVLYVWDARAMTEEGSPVMTLLRFGADGAMLRAPGPSHGVILGVVPDERGVALWRAPIGGQRSDVTTTQWLSPALVAEDDVLASERIPGFYYACPHYLLEPAQPDHSARGRLVCGDGQTWTFTRSSVQASYAFGANVVAAATGRVTLAVRHAPDSSELVVESFGGEIARLPVRGHLHGAALASEGGSIVLAWTDGGTRDTRGDRRAIATIECP